MTMKNVYEVLRSKEIDLERLRNEVERKPRPDLVWSPALEKNKWPLNIGQPGPTYSDS
jgi:hypothetical protein